MSLADAAATLYATSLEIYEAAQIDGWGAVRLYTLTSDDKKDGWEPVIAPAPTKDDPELPDVGYVIDITVSEHRAMAILFRMVSGGLAMVPMHGLKWHNAGYLLRIGVVVDLEAVTIDEQVGHCVRDLLKVSLLMYYFTVIAMPRQCTYHFKSTRATIVFDGYYVNDACVITIHWPVWHFRAPRRETIGTVQELIKWAEANI